MEKVEVTQADKDAAEAVIYGQKHVDLGDFYQAFARHRIEATRANDEEIAELVGALEMLFADERVTVMLGGNPRHIEQVQDHVLSVLAKHQDKSNA